MAVDDAAAQPTSRDNSHLTNAPFYAYAEAGDTFNLVFTKNWIASENRENHCCHRAGGAPTVTFDAAHMTGGVPIR